VLGRPSAQRPPWPARLWLLLALAFASLLARGLLLPVAIVDRDEASYRAAAHALRHGALLYRDVADHHPPLAYVYYALVEALSGLGMLGVRLVTVLLVVPLSAYALSACFEHDRRGTAAACLYVVWGAAFLGHDMLAVNCEVLLLLPACGALAVLRDASLARRPARLLLAGSLAGVAVLVKYQAALWLPALAWAAAWALTHAPTAAAEPTRWRSARALARASLWLGLGCAWPLVLCWAYFAARGAGAEFLYWNLTHNVGYTFNTLSRWAALERAGAYLLPFVLVTSPLAWAAWRGRSDLDAYRRRLVDGLLLASVLGSTLGWRFYPHYFVPLYVPLALAAGAWLGTRSRKPWPRAVRYFAAVTLGLWLGFTLLNGWLYYGRTRFYPERQRIFGLVATWLQRDACEPDARLFVWGYAPEFYALSGLRPATRFLFIEASLVGYMPGDQASAADGDEARTRVLARHWDWLMDDLGRTRPAYVIDTAGLPRLRFKRFHVKRYPRLAAWLASDYRPALELSGLVVWRRLDCQPTPGALPLTPADAGP
jgi:hypothetical protein